MTAQATFSSFGEDFLLETGPRCSVEEDDDECFLPLSADDEFVSAKLPLAGEVLLSSLPDTKRFLFFDGLKRCASSVLTSPSRIGRKQRRIS